METLNDIALWRGSQTWIQPSIECLDLSFYRQRIIDGVYSVVDGIAETEVDSPQSWFGSDEWQAAERKVDQYIQEGKIEQFNTMEDFLNTL